MIPSVNIQEISAGLSILPAGSKVVAIAGPSTIGPLNEPQALGMVGDIRSTFGRGPLAEAAALHASNGIIPVCCRVAATTDGSATLTSGVTGTSVPTLAASPDPIDDLYIRIRFRTGGVRGTAGIQYQISYNGGINEDSYGATTALGIDIAITLPPSEAGTVVVNLGAGTIIAGDYIDILTTAPAPVANDLTAGYDALARNGMNWGQVLVATPMTSSLLAATHAAMIAWIQTGRRAWWLGNCALPTPSQTMPQYLAAQRAIFDALDSTYGSVGFGDWWQSSALTSREQLRPISYKSSVRIASVKEHIDVAQRTLGSLGTRILDSKSNVARYDETTWPGADDARFMSARRWAKKVGVFINNPRLLAQPGALIEFIQHRRVANLAQSLLDDYFADALSSTILADKKTGFILDSEAKRLEKNAVTHVLAVLGVGPMVSDFTVVLSRTDQLLSTKTITGAARLVPLGYPKTINLEFGFYNPALQVR
jgi:hypothetical protein